MLRFALAIAVSLSIAGAAHADPRKWAEGIWVIHPDDFEWYAEVQQTPDNEMDELKAKHSCNGPRAMRVRITAEGTRYTSDYPFAENPAEATSRIFWTTERTFALQYDGETRLMDNDELHIWHMAFETPDRFVWIRHDWTSEGLTTWAFKKFAPRIS